MVMLRPALLLSLLLAVGGDIGGGGGGLGGASVDWGGPRKPIPPLPILAKAAPDSILARLGEPLFRSAGRTAAVSFSPDGTLYSWGPRGLVRFDAHGTPSVVGRTDSVHRLSVSTLHSPFWSSGHHGSWEGEGRRLRPPGCISSPEGTFPMRDQEILGACEDGLWKGEERLLEGDFDGILTVEPGGRLALLRSGTRPHPERIRVVDLEKGEVLTDQTLFPTKDGVCSGEECRVAGKEGVWMWTRGGEWHPAGYSPNVGAEAVSLGPGKRWAALSSREVVVLDGERPICRMEGEGWRSLSLSPDGTRLALGGEGLTLLDVEACRWAVPPDPLPSASQLVAAPQGWILLGNREVLVSDGVLKVTRQGKLDLAEPDSLAVHGDTLYWGMSRLEGPPVRVSLSTLRPDRLVDSFAYRTEPLVDILSGRIPPREPVAISPDGTMYARGIKELVVGSTTGKAPQPYELRPFFDPDSPPPPRPPPPPPLPSPKPSSLPADAAGKSQSSILAKAVEESMKNMGGAFEDILGKGGGATQGLDTAMGGRDRGPKRLSTWRVGTVTVGEGGRLVAFRFDLEFTYKNGDTTTSGFTGLLDTGGARVRPLPLSGRATHLLLDRQDRFLVALSGEVRLLSLEGVEKGSASLPRGRVQDVALSPDGSWLAVGTEEALGVYTLGEKPVLTAHVDTGQGGIKSLDFRGNHLGILGEDGSLMVVDAPSLTKLKLLPAPVTP